MLKLYENAVFALFIQKQITEAFCDRRFSTVTYISIYTIRMLIACERDLKSSQKTFSLIVCVRLCAFKMH